MKVKGKAGGFFTPQDEGGKCKLTIIFEDRKEQDLAFMLRYQDVFIELASEHQESGELPTPMKEAMRYINPMIKAINEIMSEYNIKAALINTNKTEVETENTASDYYVSLEKYLNEVETENTAPDYHVSLEKYLNNETEKEETK